ncbi:MAG: DUF4404 family protein [Porticoccus sp.]
MTNEEFQKQLDELHGELEKASTLGPEERDLFGRLMSDIVKISQGEEPENKPKETLQDQLERKASDFESGHPRLAAVIRQILESLNKMGV